MARIFLALRTEWSQHQPSARAEQKKEKQKCRSDYGQLRMVKSERFFLLLFISAAE